MYDVPLPENHDNIYESPLTSFVKERIVGRVLEDILEKLDVTLPDNEREGEEDEARIFGSTYNIICETIEKTTIEWLTEVLPDFDITRLITAPFDLRNLNANIQAEEMVK